MTFGVCARPEEAAEVLAAGFDYLEVPAFALNGLEETWDPAPYSGLPIRATNLFFDPRIRLFGPERTPPHAYAARTIERAASLGVRIMVIGSGGARRAPERFDGEAAFIALVGELQIVASEYGIILAPESLNADETNVGVHLGPFSQALTAVGAGFTADSYHLLREWDREGRQGDEPADAFDEQGLWHLPTHVHIAPIDRGMPQADDPYLLAFAARLKGYGYDGMVSLESNRGPGFDLASANRVVRELFAHDPATVLGRYRRPKLRLIDGIPGTD